VIGDLYELTRGQRPGRAVGDATSITLFKSVGAALEDLAAAELAVTARSARRPS
jgi:ornithine cyclodeaminase/alanine dehydrogenase-like protein (mu-crystallin family)